MLNNGYKSEVFEKCFNIFTEELNTLFECVQLFKV